MDEEDDPTRQFILGIGFGFLLEEVI
uniref:Uncharacterized protein n=1 Tax=Arundo donax TaxID=35708 RepID=A0A0A9CCW3_ARUDO